MAQGAFVIKIVVAVVVIGLGMVLAGIGIHNRVTFGTFYTSGPPPRVEWCGRTYNRGRSEESLAPTLGQDALTRIGSTPSGLPIVAYVMSPAERATYHTNVCTTEVFVQLSPNRYVGYGISGGP